MNGGKRPAGGPHSGGRVLYWRAGFMEAVFDSGIYLPELDLWLDSRRRRAAGVISHAHTDHTARHRRPLLTPNTRRLLDGYLKGCDPVELPYGEPLETADYTLTLHPAGHCLGSAQALVQSRATGERLLYTGDLKLQSSPVNEPLAPVSCDTLIIEATYGAPEYAFPPQEQTLQTAFAYLRRWLEQGQRPVVLGWRLGKAQELLFWLLEAGFEALLEEGVYEATQAYRQAGVEFPGAVRRFDGSWPEGTVALFPPGQRSRALDGFAGKQVMELTGWAAAERRGWRRRADISLPLSDHADYHELLAYARATGARRVYTVFGFPHLAAALRAAGTPALHLGKGAEPATTGAQLPLI